MRLTTSRRHARPASPAPRPRRGVSLVEIVVAMTLLSFIIGSLGLLAAKNVSRGTAVDVASARTFVLMEQANRFAVLPYDSITAYAPVTDTITAGRYRYLRRVSYVQGTTGSEYKTVKVLLLQTTDTTKKDSLMFQRAKTYDHTPLFTQ